MDRLLDFPYRASSDLEVVPLTFEGRAALAVRGRECGATVRWSTVTSRHTQNLRVESAPRLANRREIGCRMKDRRRAETVCERCGHKINPAIGACVACSRLAGIVFTRRVDPVDLRPPRYGSRKIVGSK